VRSLWQDATRREVVERLGRLTPENRAAWGTMTAPRMVAHVADAMRMALGDLPTKSKRLPLRHPPFKQLFVYVLPFPKNAPTARELLSREPGGWETELAACRALIERFGAERRDRDWPEHPAFGRLSARQWGILGYRHVDHHLRQFGV